jgi:pyridoxal phosphate-dependent aminotransferase EpsN
MGDLEQRYVREAFETNWLSSIGPNLDAFEAELSAHYGRPVVALGSGTAAIHLGLRLLGVGPGDEVVCPTLTFIASVNPAMYQGARPVFVDSERTSWNMDPDLLEELFAARAKTGRLPKAVVVVHLFGQTADLDRIAPICERYGVTLFEDAAEAVGTLHHGKPAGTVAKLAAISFNGNKIITTTGGGALIAEDPKAAAKVKFWSTQAREPGIAYEHREVGFNYRMSNVLAGIGRGQLAVLADRVRARRAVFDRYRAAFADLAGVSPMPEAPWNVCTRWLSVFLIDPTLAGTDPRAVIEALGAVDIEARPVWKPMHLQPLFADAECVGGAVAEQLFGTGICLPSTSSMTHAEQDRVIEIVRGCVKGR